MARPRGLLKWFFDAPAWLYRHGFGWLLGRRILAVTHRGRKSGRTYDTVLEVAVHDRATSESIVASAYGEKADWYRNIEAEPAIRVRTGRLDYEPVQRFLSADEARAAAERFCREHRFEARLGPKVLPAIGAAVPDTDDPVELLAALPMVAFRPR
jgi:deazaflavin-dependent oxidoreductase (nitroreductase family)